MLAISIGFGGDLAQVTGTMEQVGQRSPVLTIHSVRRVVRDLDQTCHLIDLQPQGTGPRLLQAADHVGIIRLQFPHRVEGANRENGNFCTLSALSGYPDFVFGNGDSN